MQTPWVLAGAVLIGVGFNSCCEHGDYLHSAWHTCVCLYCQCLYCVSVVVRAGVTVQHA